MNDGDEQHNRSPPPPESPWWLPSLARTNSPVSATGQHSLQASRGCVQAGGAALATPSDLYKLDGLTTAPHAPQAQHSAKVLCLIRSGIVMPSVTDSRHGLPALQLCSLAAAVCWVNECIVVLLLLLLILLHAGLPCAPAALLAQHEQQPPAPGSSCSSWKLAGTEAAVSFAAKGAQGHSGGAVHDSSWSTRCCRH